jgi:EAL domain-containing protein (putative c-di-GMP-specific phosphodiesterase class I)
MVKPVMVSGELLQSLLYEGALRVASQPILSLTDRQIVSREMLIRGPAGALQQPAELFRYCFEKDILTPVDLHCLKKCVKAASEFADGLRIHVNLMPSTLLETPTNELISLLQEDDSKEFCVEISEQQLLSDPSHLVPTVKAMQEAHIQIAMDDVGFGKSCLEGLIMLRPEILKIDKKLIIGLGEDRTMRLALKRLLRVTEVLETEVIAEGIETEQDLVVLQDYGVAYGQGYFFGEPEFNDGQSAVTEPNTVKS